MADLNDRIESFLAQLGQEPVPAEDGLYLLRYGSTALAIRTLVEVNSGIQFLRLSAATLSDFEPSAVLVREILQLNAEVLFGAFVVYADNTLCFRVTLPAANLSFEDFEMALAYVARISDEYDDILQALAGGNRASDLFTQGS
jgi:hypothetical protein